MYRSARLLGRLLVGMLTPVLLGAGPAALAGGPIHDPNDGAFPTPSRSLDGAPSIGTAGPTDFGWMVQGAAVVLLAVAVLVWLFDLVGRRRSRALPQPR